MASRASLRDGVCAVRGATSKPSETGLRAGLVRSGAMLNSLTIEDIAILLAIGGVLLLAAITVVIVLTWG